VKQTNKLKRLPFLVASHSARSSASCDSTSSPPATHPKEESFFNSKLYYSAPFSAVALFRAFPRCISLCFEPPHPPKGNFLLFHSFAHLIEDHFLLKFISNLLQRSSSRANGRDEFSSQKTSLMWRSKNAMYLNNVFY
jgi:hypothetical protein